MKKKKKIISIISLFPNFFLNFCSTSIIKKAIKKKIIKIKIYNLRKFARKNKVDDYSYGGYSKGMILKCEPIVRVLKKIKKMYNFKKTIVILLSPKGRTFNQEYAEFLSSNYEHIILICGHYEGIDERIKYYIDIEISVGDYILTGGELPAMIISDAVIRLEKKVLSKKVTKNDSFSNGLLEYSHYTRPKIFDNFKVPKILISGNHEKIKFFNLLNSIKKTFLLRQDLFKKNVKFKKKNNKIIILLTKNK